LNLKLNLKNLNLRKRLLVLFLVTSLIPLIIFSAVSVTSFFLKSQKDTYKFNEKKLDSVASEINGMLNNYFGTLRTIARQPAVRNFDLEEVKGILADAARINPDLDLCLDNKEGDQLVKSNDDDLINVFERDFFQRAIKGNELYVSDVVLAKTTGKFMITISTPVRDNNSNIVGVLQANIQLDKLSEYVTELSQDGSSVYILSRQKTVLAHPNIEYVNNQEDFGNLAFVAESASADVTTSRAKNINGEAVIASYCYNYLTGWLIVVETPVKIAMESVYDLIKIYGIMFVIVTIIIVLSSRYFAKDFAKPLITLASVMKTIADGELKEFDFEINSNDEIGQVYESFKIMSDNLRELVNNIQTASIKLVSQATQLSTATDEATQSLTQVVTTINEMAQGNSDQASMVQSTTDAINLVNDIVSDATIKTETAADKAKESLDLALEGQKAIERQTQKIEENNKYTKEVGESIHELAAMAGEVRNIVAVINDIATQTNLLALNASIEAARAGESGRGFAVVAEEIRKLAEQSGNSTKRIEDIVKNIGSKVEETVNNMNQVKESVIVMGASAEDTRRSFDRIFSAVTELAQIAKEVNTAFEEISRKTEEVSEQAMSISAVIEEASASMEEISASSEEQLASVETITYSTEQLKNMAGSLMAQVKKFKIIK